MPLIEDLSRYGIEDCSYSPEAPKSNVYSNCKVKGQCSICNSKKHVDVMHCDEIKQSKQVKPESKEVTENTTLSNNSCARDYNCQLEVLDEKKICASLPRMNDVLVV
ncbi:hypothetical protein TNCV_2914571 [Trichonephila clavipes]|nr:hypothetical protein TNCV_2914571 [Trichonephila clavipes]